MSSGETSLVGAYLVAFCTLSAAFLVLRFLLVFVPAGKALREFRERALVEAPTLGPRDLQPTELAYLVGGPKRALLTALPGTSPDETPPPDADPLSRRLREYGTGEWGRDVDDFLSACAPELAAIQQSLERRGLALPPRARNSVARRNFVLDVVILVVFVPLLLTLGEFHVPPVGIALVVAVTAGCVALHLVLRRHNLRLPTAVALARRAREEFAYLDPKLSPAYASYGPGAIPTATALFGGAALDGVTEVVWLPAFKAVLDTQQLHPRRSYPDLLSCGVAGAKGCGSTSCSGWDLAVGTGTGCSSCGIASVS